MNLGPNGFALFDQTWCLTFCDHSNLILQSSFIIRMNTKSNTNYKSSVSYLKITCVTPRKQITVISYLILKSRFSISEIFQLVSLTAWHNPHNLQLFIIFNDFLCLSIIPASPSKRSCYDSSQKFPPFKHNKFIKSHCNKARVERKICIHFVAWLSCLQENLRSKELSTEFRCGDDPRTKFLIKGSTFLYRNISQIQGIWRYLAFLHFTDAHR